MIWNDDTEKTTGIIREEKYGRSNITYVDIVRCKDCVNCIKEPNGDLYCDVLAIGYEPLGSKRVTDDWFCADGERRTDDA